VALSEEKYKPIQQTVTDFVENGKEISQEEIISQLTVWTEELNELLLSAESLHRFF
jgi:hypothetical protein